MVELSIELPKGFLDYEARMLIVPRWRKEVWAIVLDLLMQFDRACRKHNIKYFCDGGTALGAVRHRGFVPWDDDLDVVMSRAEYAKLEAIAPTEFSHPYFWQTEKTDPGSARGHAQLRNSNTTAILKKEMRDGKAIYSFNQGIFIDIFPFDNIPDDDDERKCFIAKLKKCKSRIAVIKARRFAAQYLCSGVITPRKAYWRFKAFILRVYESLKRVDALTEAVNELEKMAQMYNGVKTKEVAPVAFKPDHREVLPASFFDNAVMEQFEFVKIPIMEHCREALSINYGNWHEHVIGSSVHGGLFIDTNHPYTDYL